MSVYNAASTLALALLSVTASSQLASGAETWTLKTPVASPGGISMHGMAYDGARGQVVLFGGHNRWSPINETWVYDGVTWVNKNPVSAPSWRYHSAMAYDAERQQVVLFGGCGYNGLADTWVWDGSNWIQKTPAASPSGRCGHSMAYNAARRRVVLFGGSDGVTPSSLSDTWEWDGANWTLKNPAVNPLTRAHHAMTYDAARKQVVVFGGIHDSGLYPNITWVDLNDTWVWDGTTWTNKTPAMSPPARNGFGMAYDAASRRVVLFGGWTQAGVLLDDTWVWDGNTWSQKAPLSKPSARWRHSLVLDEARMEVLLFGGQDYTADPMRNDTWAWHPPAPIDLFLHGSGSTANPPTLFLDSTSPVGTTAKYRDSAGIRFSGGNLWQPIGTWQAAPALTRGNLSAPGDLRGWIGLKNSDDQGTRFDLRAEVYWNTLLIASGESYCITGVTRNPDLAKQATVPFAALSPVLFNGTTDALSLKILTRIGTDGAGNFCGGHGNAVGLRFYMDSTSRPSKFAATF